jgi:hypothetical protein
MNVDLGLQGWALLIIPALVFGAIAQAIFWKSGPHWLWLVGVVAWVAGGFAASEIVFGAETTEENLQPLINGLLWDEALMGGLLVGFAAVLATVFLYRRSHHPSGVAS